MKKNIAIFIENYVAGGSDKIARDLVDGLEYENLYLFVNARDDFRVLLQKKLDSTCHLITYDIPTIHELGERANSYRGKSKLLYVLFKVFNLIIRYPLMFFYIFYFYFKFRKYNIDVFFSNNGGYPGGECNRTATLAAFLLKLDNYHIVHNLATYPFFRWYKYIEYFIDFLISKTSQIICVSEQTRDYLLERRFVDKNKVVVIHNGVEIVSNKIEKNFEFDQTLRILNIGALGERKNQRLIIDALNILKQKKNLSIELYIIGNEEDFGYTDMLKSQISMYKLQEQVFFEGFQSNIYDYYNKCDIFVLSSNVESFALVRVEAMSIGMPIITTDVGNAELQVIEDKNGYIIESDIELATAIERYIVERSLIEKHARYGFDHFMKHFTIDTMINKYQELVER